MDMIGIQYNAKLQRLVKQVKADISKEIMPLVRQLAPEYTQDAAATTDAWSDLITNAMGFLFAKWQNERVSAGAQRIASEFVQASVKKSERDMKKSVGIDVFSGSKTMQDYLHASAQQNAQLAQAVLGKAVRQKRLFAAVRDGDSGACWQPVGERHADDQYGAARRPRRWLAQAEHRAPLPADRGGSGARSARPLRTQREDRADSLTVPWPPRRPLPRSAASPSRS